MKKKNEARKHAWELVGANEIDKEDKIFLRISKKLLLLYSITPKYTEHVIDCDMLIWYMKWVYDELADTLSDLNQTPNPYPNKSVTLRRKTPNI